MNELIKEELKNCKGKYITAILIGTIINLLVICSMAFSKIYIDRVSVAASVSITWIFLILYCSVNLIKFFLMYIRELLMTKLSFGLLKDTRNNIFSRVLLDFKISTFVNEKQSYILKLFDDWICSITWFLSNVLLTTISDVILLLMSVVAILIVDWKVFIIISLILPLYGLIYFKFNGLIRNSRIKTMDDDVRVSQSLKDSLDGIKEIRSTCTESKWMDSYSAVQEEYVKSNYNFEKISSGYQFIVNAINVLAHFAVLSIGSFMIFKGKYTVGTVITLDSLISLLFTPVEKIINFNRLHQVFKAEYQKVNDFITGNQESLTFNGHKANEDSENTLLKIKDLSFAYENSNPIFSHVFLSFDKGKAYALTGPNGSGKSTFVNIILGFIRPKEGIILFNNRNILCDLTDYRTKIGYVPLNPFFINASIKDNILFKRKEIDEALLNSLISACEIDSFMKNNNYTPDYIIGQNGENLSAGQRQRIAICRALYSNPDLLIIDEGTESLDSISEANILDNIRNLYKDITIILITHRQSSIDYCDKRYILKDCKWDLTS